MAILERARVRAREGRGRGRESFKQSPHETRSPDAGLNPTAYEMLAYSVSYCEMCSASENSLFCAVMACVLFSDYILF